jgi:hypothetical protein
MSEFGVVVVSAGFGLWLFSVLGPAVAKLLELVRRSRRGPGRPLF